MRISLNDYDELVKKRHLPAIDKKPIGFKDTRTDSGASIRLVIYGEPVSKPRMTQRDKWHKRPCTQRYWDWAERVRGIARSVPDTKDIAEVNWKAFFEPPKSWPKKKRFAAMDTPHTLKPDRDNIDKAVLDALWKSDSGIHAGRIAKFWGKPARIEIEIVLAQPFLEANYV
jgi:Holliday junction resolvase RusA-like endonuclease